MTKEGAMLQKVITILILSSTILVVSFAAIPEVSLFSAKTEKHASFKTAPLYKITNDIVFCLKLSVEQLW
jgi:hypothetical protein